MATLAHLVERPLPDADPAQTLRLRGVAVAVGLLGLAAVLAALVGNVLVATGDVDADNLLWTFGVSVAGFGTLKLAIALVLTGIVVRLWMRVDAVRAKGQSFGARIGNLSGKIKIVEASAGKTLRWKAGPGPLLAMGMGMKGTLELHAHNGSTHVHLTMKSPPMMRPMMQAMTGLKTAAEMTKTINRIKQLGEQHS